MNTDETVYYIRSITSPEGLNCAEVCLRLPKSGKDDFSFTVYHEQVPLAAISLSALESGKAHAGEFKEPSMGNWWFPPTRDEILAWHLQFKSTKTNGPMLEFTGNHIALIPTTSDDRLILVGNDDAKEGLFTLPMASISPATENGLMQALYTLGLEKLGANLTEFIGEVEPLGYNPALGCCISVCRVENFETLLVSEGVRRSLSTRVDKLLGQSLQVLDKEDLDAMLMQFLERGALYRASYPSFLTPTTEWVLEKTLEQPKD